MFKPRRFNYRDADSPLPLGGTTLRHVRYPALPLVSRILNGATCGRRLLPELREFAPDVVLAYQIYPEAFGALYAARRLKVPCVVGAIGSDLRCSPKIVRPLVRSALRRSSAVVTVCDELTGRAIAMGADPARVTTILNGCDHTIFYHRDRREARESLGVRQDSRQVVFAGNLVQVKGLPNLVRAAGLLEQAGMPVDVTLIGSGPLQGELRELSRTLGIEQRVRLTGSLPPAKVAEWLGAADIFCLPSYSEGSPNAMVEALRCGRPVVASNVGGIPELLTAASGILTPPGNPSALADALREAFARSWDEAAISQLYRRTWDDMAQETYDVCLRALDQEQPAVQPISMTTY